MNVFPVSMDLNTPSPGDTSAIASWFSCAVIDIGRIKRVLCDIILNFGHDFKFNKNKLELDFPRKQFI